MAINKKKHDEMDEQLVVKTIDTLKHIYSNKSSDEYRSHGDITKSSEYQLMEFMVSDLNNLRGFNREEALNLKTLFLSLHRPMFKKMVSEFIVKDDERNTCFTLVYTVGYRVLIGELSRIFSSTVATDRGLVYKPDKISRKNSMKSFIKVFNQDLDRKVEMYVKQAYKKNKSSGNVKQESYVVEGGVNVLNVIDTTAAVGVGIVDGVLDIINNVFRTATELNPISLISSLMTRSYDNKMRKFKEVSDMYHSTRKAYEEYMKLPMHDRKKRIEHKYAKNIEKYNIKMQNLSKKIEHFDERSREEIRDKTYIRDDWDDNNISGSSSSSTSSTSTSSNDNDNSDAGDFDF